MTRVQWWPAKRRDEPCGCPYGSADSPFLRSFIAGDLELDFDDELCLHAECDECGAVWSTRDDSFWCWSG